MPEETRLRRRALRCGLLSGIVLISLAIIHLSQERNAARIIRSHGGKVDWQFLHVQYVGFSEARNFGDEDLAALAPALHALERLKSLSFYGTDITDDGVEYLEDLTTLEWLYLGKTSITDHALESIVECPHISYLSVEDTKIIGEKFGSLRQLSALEILRLNGTEITDESLKAIGKLKSLRSLYLNDTRISDKGLRHLRGLTNLERLELNDTQVTNAGLVTLGELSSLKFVTVVGTRVTEQGAHHLKEIANQLVHIDI